MTIHDIISIVSLSITVIALIVVAIVLRRVNRSFDEIAVWAQTLVPDTHYMSRLGRATRCGIARRNVAESYDAIDRVTCGSCRTALGFDPLPPKTGVTWPL